MIDKKEYWNVLTFSVILIFTIYPFTKDFLNSVIGGYFGALGLAAFITWIISKERPLQKKDLDDIFNDDYD